MKEKYRGDVTARLKEVEGEIEKLRASASQLEQSSQDRFNELMKNLHTSKAVVEEELMELVETEAWDKLEARMDTAIKNLHAAVKDVAAQCK
jgi:F0F1-type ATP synthase membrane subunit b/b'